MNTYQEHYEEQVARQLNLPLSQVHFKERLESTSPPMMVCMVSGQPDYEEVFTWDILVGDLDSKTAVVPRIGKIQTPNDAFGVLSFTLESNKMPSAPGVLSFERRRMQESEAGAQV